MVYRSTLSFQNTRKINVTAKSKRRFPSEPDSCLNSYNPGQNFVQTRSQGSLSVAVVWEENHIHRRRFQHRPPLINQPEAEALHKKTQNMTRCWDPSVSGQVPELYITVQVDVEVMWSSVLGSGWRMLRETHFVVTSYERLSKNSMSRVIFLSY